MKKVVRSPWFPLTLCLLGMTSGYSFVVLKQGDVLAAGRQCPAERCRSGNCGADCRSGNCGATCPGNCAKGQL